MAPTTRIEDTPSPKPRDPASKYAVDQTPFKNTARGAGAKAPMLRPANWTRRNRSLDDLSNAGQGEDEADFSNVPPKRLFGQPRNEPARNIPRKDTINVDNREGSEQPHQSYGYRYPSMAPSADAYGYTRSSVPPIVRKAPRMPNRSDSNAPKFDGKSGTVTPFLDEIENWAALCALEEPEMIKFTLQYIPTLKDRTLWSTRPAVKTGNWKQFKQQIYELYPGAGEVPQFTLGSIKTLVEKQAKIPIKDRDDVGDFYRELINIVDYRRENKLGSVDNPGEYFLQGLYPPFRKLVKGQLRMKDPDHELDAPWPLKDVYQAALKMSVSDEAKEVNAQASVTGKNEKSNTYDVSRLLDAISADHDNAANILETFINKVVDKRGRVAGGRPRNTDCIFCSDPGHFHHECSKVAEYIKKGLCKRNEGNRLVLPDGRPIPRDTAGKNLKEKLDTWYRVNPEPGKTVSANIQEIESLNVTSSLKEAPPCATVEEVVKQHEASAPVQQPPLDIPFSEIDDLQVLEALAIQAQKKAEEQREKLRNKRRQTRSMTQAAKTAEDSVEDAHEDDVPLDLPQPVPSSGSPVHTPIEVSIPKEFIKEDSGRAKYISPIENPASVERVADLSLDCTVTVPLRDLLAIAPDVRRRLKELVVAKRMPVGPRETANAVAVEALYQAMPPSLDDVIVSNHYEDLRAVDVLVNGNVPTEAVLDSGSQIVAISKEVWERTGLPLQRNRVVRLESANTSKNVSLGLLENMKLVVGGLTFWVQAQVLEYASYDMLLGLPFMTLAKGVLQHFSDNQAELSIVDPNTGDEALVPTRARIRQADRKKAINTLGISEGKDIPCKSEPDSQPVFSHKDEEPLGEHKPVECPAYKKSVNDIRTVVPILPEKFHLVRKRPPDPLASLPALLMRPPGISLELRYRKVHVDAVKANDKKVLQRTDEKVVHYLIKSHDADFTWDESKFPFHYFEPVVIPTVEHIPNSEAQSVINNITNWPAVAAAVFWADRITIRKSTQCSPFHIAYGGTNLQNH